MSVARQASRSCRNFAAKSTLRLVTNTIQLLSLRIPFFSSVTKQVPKNESDVTGQIPVVGALLHSNSSPGRRDLQAEQSQPSLVQLPDILSTKFLFE